MQLSPAELARLREPAESESDDDLVCTEVELSPEELRRLKAPPPAESSDDDLECEEAPRGADASTSVARVLDERPRRPRLSTADSPHAP